MKLKYFITIYGGFYIIYAVLLSGGVGSRMGYDIPKQFIEINDKPLLAHCIDKFVEISDFKKIIVSSPEGYFDETKELINEYFKSNNNIVVILGGETRQDTLMNSLKYIKSIDDSKDIIVINHDAARIFVSLTQIKKSIKYTLRYGSASPIIPSTDVIIEKSEDSIKNIPNRYNLVHVQTPQGFKLDEYCYLFNNLSEKDKRDVHEIVKVYFLNNKFIKLFEGEKNNFKITNPLDIKIAETILGDNI